jgi:hypothetical protein
VPSKRWQFSLLAAAIGLLVALLLCELALRFVVATNLLAGPNSFTAFMQQVETAPTSEAIFRQSADPELGFELVPGTQRGHLRINREGFRGPETPRERPPGVVRVAFIGDSETFAARLREPQILPGLVERELNRAETATRYQTLNFGVPGYNTAQEQQVLQTRVLNFEPAVLVLFYVLNDPEMQGRVMLLRSTPLAHSYTYMLAVWLAAHRESRVSRLKAENPGIVAYYQALHDSSHFEVSWQLILEMGRTLDERGIEFVLVIAPELIGFNSFREYPYREIHAQLAALASERVHVIDPLEDLMALDQPPHNLWVTRSDPHKNAAAHRAIAGRVARHILSAPSRSRADPG